ncbi:unnamed protein product, partial [Meganyctiphanes norvegica]
MTEDTAITWNKLLKEMDSKFKIIHNSLNPKNYNNVDLNSEPISTHQQHHKTLNDDLNLVSTLQGKNGLFSLSNSPPKKKTRSFSFTRYDMLQKSLGLSPKRHSESDTSIDQEQHSVIASHGIKDGWSHNLVRKGLDLTCESKIVTGIDPGTYVPIASASHYKGRYLTDGSKVVTGIDCGANVPILSASHYSPPASEFNCQKTLLFHRPKCKPKVPPKPKFMPVVLTKPKPPVLPKPKQVVLTKPKPPPVPPKPKLKQHSHSRDNRKIHHEHFERILINFQNPQNQVQQYDINIEEHKYNLPKSENIHKNKESDPKNNPIGSHGDLYNQIYDTGTQGNEKYTLNLKYGNNKSIDEENQSMAAMENTTSEGAQVKLWQHLPLVRHSRLLSILTPREVSLQESMYEVVTSEASYLKSLNFLLKHFVEYFELQKSLTYKQSRQLFSSISAIKMCSEKFLSDLETRCQESIRMSSISDIILKHIGSSSQVYINYCTNTIYQEKMLQQLLSENSQFCQVVHKLEASPECQGLRLLSFLILPMQRVTRLPLLIKAILKYLEEATYHWQEASMAMHTLEELVNECNEGTRRTENLETVLEVYQSLNFHLLDHTPAMSASSCLLRQTHATILLSDLQDGATSFFYTMVNKKKVKLFLFTDLFILCEEKKDDEYLVLDCCLRSLTQIEELSQNEIFPSHIFNVKKIFIRVTMLQNHQNKTTELIMSISSEIEKEYWVNAFNSIKNEDFQEIVYEDWNLPIVEAVYDFNESQPEFLLIAASDVKPDFLSIAVGDIIKIQKKIVDGWNYGQRLSDGACGWFPDNCIKEIPSDNLRARNLWKRHNLLKCTQSIINQIKYYKE